MYSSTTIRLNILVDFILYLYKPMLLVLQQSEKGKILPISIPSGICLDLYPCTFISLLYGMKNLMKINSFINPKQDTHFFYYALPTWLLANKSHLLIIQLFYRLPLYFHHPMHLLYTHDYSTIPINSHYMNFYIKLLYCIHITFLFPFNDTSLDTFIVQL